MAIGSTTSRAEATHSRLAWKQWLVPSVADLIFVALLYVLVLTNLSVRLLGDAGIGWHIRTGQLILATHAIPRIDPFSSSMSGHPWFAWEWLYDVLVGWLESATGLNGVVFFSALIIALTFSWAFRLLLRRGTNIPAALVLVLLAASASMIHFLTRPHVVSWLFVLAWFWILEWSESDSRLSTSDCGQGSTLRNRRRWLLWLLPFLMLLWVNMHGGFLLGFVLLMIYWLSDLWQWFRLGFRGREARFDDFLLKIRTGRRLRDLTLIGILSAAATLLNPYGFKLHIHIYRYLSNGFLMDHIDEFQSPNFHYVAQKCFATLLLLTLVALAAKRRQVSQSHMLLVLFAVYSGLYASRNIPVSSLLLILVIGPWLSKGMARLAESHQMRARGQDLVGMPFMQRMEAIESSMRGHLWPIASILLTCWVVMHGGRLGATTLMDAHFDNKRFPVAAASYLEKQHLQGPVLSPDSWGGYLIYRFHPRMKVVVDDRHDFYGEKFLKSYLKLIHAEPGWQEFLQNNPPQCVVAPKDSALANILLETSGWNAIDRDDVTDVFIPASQAR